MKQQRQSRVDISLNMVRCWSINNTANILFNKHSSRMIYCNTFPPEDAWMLIFWGEVKWEFVPRIYTDENCKSTSNRYT
jgi:hypothetical protein